MAQEKPGRAMKFYVQRKLIFFAIGFLFVIASCHQAIESPTTADSIKTPATSKATVAPEQSPTDLQTATTTMDPKPITAIPQVTTTLTSLATASQTPLPFPRRTWTPLPTLAFKEALTQVLTLYETNNGCQLPCWWGVMPGETTWVEAMHFLAPLAFELEEQFVNDDPNLLFAVVTFPDENTAQTGRTDRHWQVNRIEDGTIQMIKAGADPVSNLSPASILSNYGVPSEVYLRTANHPMGNFLSFSVTLFYQKLGFMVKFTVDNAVVENGLVKACLRESRPFIVVWSPKQLLTLEGVANKLANEIGPEYMQELNQVTDMDVETFHETFSIPETPFCLETPAEHWPGP